MPPDLSYVHVGYELASLYIRNIIPDAMWAFFVGSSGPFGAWQSGRLQHI